MTDWSLAFRIAAGGFGLVFFLLALLSVVVWAASRLLLRMAKDKATP